MASAFVCEECSGIKVRVARTKCGPPRRRLAVAAASRECLRACRDIAIKWDGLPAGLPAACAISLCCLRVALQSLRVAKFALSLILIICCSHELYRSVYKNAKFCTHCLGEDLTTQRAEPGLLCSKPPSVDCTCLICPYVPSRHAEHAWWSQKSSWLVVWPSFLFAERWTVSFFSREQDMCNRTIYLPLLSNTSSNRCPSFL